MRGAERVVGALVALGEAVGPVALADAADAVAPPGEDLVRVGLVAHVPDQPVGGRVEDVVQGHRQLDDAEPGAEVAAGLRGGVHGLGPELVGKLPQLGWVQAAQIAGRLMVSSRGVATAM
jgi:hypothetical protein